MDHRSIAAAFVLATFATACGGGSGGSGSSAVSDGTAPRILSVSPAPGELVSADSTAAVSVTFDEPIDCAALPYDAIAVSEARVPVFGYVECAGDTLSFVPVPALATQTSLAATVSPRVRDRAGNAAGTARTWTFEVRPWTRHEGGPELDHANAIATSADGDVVFVGDTNGDLWGQASHGSEDLVVASYDAAGRPRFKRLIGGSASEIPRAVAVDGQRNVLIAGDETGTFPGASGSGDAAFVTKLGPDGETRWAMQLGNGATFGMGVADDTAIAVAADTVGNVYVAGSTFGAMDGAYAGGGDAFVAKFNPAGTRLWARQLGTPGLENAFAVAVDAAGNVFVAGQTTGNLDGNLSAGSYDLFVAAYDAFGQKRWTRQMGSAGGDAAYGIATDGAGGVFVAAISFPYGSGTAILDGIPSVGWTDTYVIKLDADGRKR